MPEDRPITITAKNYIIEYGETIPTFGYTSEGGILNGEPVLSCSATKKSPVGFYPIVISLGSITDNGNVTLVNGTLTIKKAPLTVVGGKYTKYIGEENPKFVPTYKGFKNQENEDVLTVKPIGETTAQTDSPAGTYDVIFSGAEAQNYEIVEYVKGTLTIKEESYFTVDGVKFKNLFDNNTVAIVGYKGSVPWNLELPGTVNHSGIEYTVTSVDGFWHTSVRHVKIPNGVTSIEADAFKWCEDLLTVDIPEGVTNIGTAAFNGCEKLSYIVLPSSLTRIGEIGFSGCKSLSYIVSYVEKPFPLNEGNEFWCNNNKIYSTTILYVPKGTKPLYLQAEGWNKFNNIVEMLSGDANGDETVDLRDIELIKEFIMTGVEPEGFKWWNADTDGNRVINVADIVNIIKQ